MVKVKVNRGFLDTVTGVYRNVGDVFNMPKSQYDKMKGDTQNGVAYIEAIETKKASK